MCTQLNFNIKQNFSFGLFPTTSSILTLVDEILRVIGTQTSIIVVVLRDGVLLWNRLEQVAMRLRLLARLTISSVCVEELLILVQLLDSW